VSLLRSLKFQIILAIFALTSLFTALTLYSLHVISQQHDDDVLVTLAAQLQVNQQNLAMQAMRYEENAPRNHASYNRDLGLYFQDLKMARADLSRLIQAFSSNRFDRDMTGEPTTMHPRLGKRSQAIADRLEGEWQSFLAGLDERIGTDPAEPRLEWAAQWIVANHKPLEKTGEQLFDALRADVARRAAQANTVNRLLLGSALIVAVGVGLWFYRRVLRPLNSAVKGFRRVANGDFSHQVPIVNDDEIGWLTRTFNQLSDRLDALRSLLTGLEQGADLDATLKTLSTTLPRLIPVDWIGMLIVAADGDFELVKAYSDGKAERLGTLRFVPENTLLAECISSREPIHIADVTGIADLSQHYVFLKRLAALGRRDAVFLPIGAGQTLGVAVFASRFPNNFRPDHLELVSNLGGLLGVSLARSIQLSESTRLASIGQFASGIAHEIRSPLATIALALGHLETIDHLGDGTRKRVQLAATEVTRLERLLSDILLYAKPLRLNRNREDLPSLLREVVSGCQDNGATIDLQCQPCPPLMLDGDRIRQVVLNLVQNAVQASPPETRVQIGCAVVDNGAHVEICVANHGDPIPAKILDRIFEPFVTTKRQGTGLGLAIVKRFIDAHGGSISISSDVIHGTQTRVRVPVTMTDVSEQDQAADGTWSD
jgi:signal transduction histidine kinase